MPLKSQLSHDWAFHNPKGKHLVLSSRTKSKIGKQKQVYKSDCHRLIEIIQQEAEKGTVSHTSVW